MDGTSGKAAAATDAAEAEDGAARPPAVSSLIEEVGTDHPMREAIEAAQAERQAGSLGSLGIPGSPGIPGRPGSSGSPGSPGRPVPVIGSTLVFYVACRLAEDCLIVPRIIGHAVHVHALAGMIAIVLGGVPPGIIAALIAIPVAAAISLILNEVTFRHLDSN